MVLRTAVNSKLLKQLIITYIRAIKMWQNLYEILTKLNNVLTQLTENHQLCSQSNLIDIISSSKLLCEEDS